MLTRTVTVKASTMGENCVSGKVLGSQNECLVKHAITVILLCLFRGREMKDMGNPYEACGAGLDLRVHKALLPCPCHLTCSRVEGSIRSHRTLSRF